MKAFLTVWAGQFLSQLGSGVAAFALAIFLYQKSGQVEDLAWIASAAYLPHILVAPFGGVLADRLDRRWLMILADGGSAVFTGGMLFLASAGRLETWSASLLVTASASCNALQWPAYEAAIVAMVPEAKLGRADGLCELTRGAAQLLAPPLAGALLGLIRLQGILLVDVLSFGAGMLALFLVNIPAHTAKQTTRKNLLRGFGTDVKAAWAFITGRPGLLAMLALFSLTNFTFAVVELLMKPLVLTLGTALQVGLVLSTVGVGMISGSLIMSAWGGPRRRIRAILAFQLIEGSSLVLCAARPWMVPLYLGAFAYGCVIPLTFSSARVLWQVLVPPDLQGRVTALRSSFVMLAIPVGYAVAVPMAGYAEAVLAGEGAASHLLSRLLGAGPGRGMALVVVCMGLVTCLGAIMAYLFRPYRLMEMRPDERIQPCLEQVDA